MLVQYHNTHPVSLRLFIQFSMENRPLVCSERDDIEKYLKSMAAGALNREKGCWMRYRSV